jgi:hypothetical protein
MRRCSDREGLELPGERNLKRERHASAGPAPVTDEKPYLRVREQHSRHKTELRPRDDILKAEGDVCLPSQAEPYAVI